MRENLQGIFEWVADRGGVLGSLVLVLVSLLLGYALVIFVLNSFRALFKSVGGGSGDEGQSSSVIAVIVRCCVSVALLVWYVSFAVSEFPEWLGL